MLLIAPVAIILVAENLGHIKAVTAMTGHDMDRYMGRAFMGDGIATMISGSAGGTGVTTYAENIGVDGGYAHLFHRRVLRGGTDRAGAGFLAQVRRADPGHSAAGDGRRLDRGLRPDCWWPAPRSGVDNKVDFSDNRNLIVAAITLILGTGDFTLKFRRFRVGRHRHRHVRRHHPVRPAGARTADLHPSAWRRPGGAAPATRRRTCSLRKRTARHGADMKAPTGPGGR